MELLKKTRFAAVLAILCGAGGAQASVTFQAPVVTAISGTSGTFDIVLVNTGADVTLGGFSIGITTTNPNITFSSATTATSLAYIFGTHSVFGPNLDTTTGISLVLSDNDDRQPLGGATVGATTVGVAHVSYTIAPGAINGSFPITFDAIQTSLVDAAGVPVAFLTSAGTFVITPEPGSVVLTGVGLLGLGWRTRRLRLGCWNGQRLPVPLAGSSVVSSSQEAPQGSNGRSGFRSC